MHIQALYHTFTRKRGMASCDVRHSNLHNHKTRVVCFPKIYSSNYGCNLFCELVKGLKANCYYEQAINL